MLSWCSSLVPGVRTYVKESIKGSAVFVSPSVILMSAIAAVSRHSVLVLITLYTLTF
jgi:hypothetical protein